MKHLSSVVMPLMAIVASSVLASGCQRIGASSRVDPVSVARYPDGQVMPVVSCDLGDGDYNGIRNVVINLDCFQFPEDRRYPSVNSRSERQTAYAEAVSSEAARNRLTDIILGNSNLVCTVEMGQLTGNEALVNTSLNILGTAATTAANIVTGGQASSILTGIGTLSHASRSHIAADVYRNTFSYAISRAITIERQKLLRELRARYGEKTTSFSVDEAIRLANEYHTTCSLYRGLALVLESVEGDRRSQEAQARRARIQELQDQVRQLIDQKNRMGEANTTRIQGLIDQLNARIVQLQLADAPAEGNSEGSGSDPAPGEPGTGEREGGAEAPNDDPSSPENGNPPEG